MRKIRIFRLLCHYSILGFLVPQKIFCSIVFAEWHQGHHSGALLVSLRKLNSLFRILNGSFFLSLSQVNTQCVCLLNRLLAKSGDTSSLGSRIFTTWMWDSLVALLSDCRVGSLRCLISQPGFKNIFHLVSSLSRSIIYSWYDFVRFDELYKLFQFIETAVLTVRYACSGNGNNACFLVMRFLHVPTLT